MKFVCVRKVVIAVEIQEEEIEIAFPSGNMQNDERWKQ